MATAPLITLVLASLATLVDVAGRDIPVGRYQREHSTAMALQRFTATDLDGRRWTADDLRGRVVLIDFWATWCAPCLAELPRLKKLRSKYSTTDFEILGVSLDVTSRQTLVGWLNRNRIEWPQIHEKTGYSGDVPRLFGIDRLPRTVLIDREGRIAAVDLRGERLVAVVDSLVSPEPVSAVAQKVK